MTDKLKSGNFLVEFTSHDDGDEDRLIDCTAAQVSLPRHSVFSFSSVLVSASSYTCFTLRIQLYIARRSGLRGAQEPAGYRHAAAVREHDLRVPVRAGRLRKSQNQPVLV